MAWNPSPEVAAARDYGKKFGFDQVIILVRRTRTGEVGYASYGATRALCDHAKGIADAALAGAIEHLETERRS